MGRRFKSGPRYSRKSCSSNDLRDFSFSGQRLQSLWLYPADGPTSSDSHRSRFSLSVGDARSRQIGSRVGPPDQLIGWGLRPITFGDQWFFTSNCWSGPKPSRPDSSKVRVGAAGFCSAAVVVLRRRSHLPFSVQTATPESGCGLCSCGGVLNSTVSFFSPVSDDGGFRPDSLRVFFALGNRPSSIACRTLLTRRLLGLSDWSR